VLVYVRFELVTYTYIDTHLVALVKRARLTAATMFASTGHHGNHTVIVMSHVVKESEYLPGSVFITTQPTTMKAVLGSVKELRLANWIHVKVT